jgi:hypothetical protein
LAEIALNVEKTMKNIVVTSSVLFLLSAATGCSYASKEEVSALRTEVAQVRRISEDSLSTANEARTIANDSNSRSTRIEEAVNRSFKKSMYK